MQRPLPEFAADTPVTAVMASPVVTVDAEAPVRELLRLFIAAGIGAAPVVNPRGELLGVVSKTDLLRAVYEDPSSTSPSSVSPSSVSPSSVSPSSVSPSSAAEPAPARDFDLRASDLMTPGPLTVLENVSIAEAASTMAREHVHRLFVAAPTGTLTGVVSAMDIVSWLGRDEHP